MKHGLAADRLDRLMHKTLFKFNRLTYPIIKFSNIDSISKILNTPYNFKYYASTSLHATERIVVKSLKECLK